MTVVNPGIPRVDRIRAVPATEPSSRCRRMKLPKENDEERLQKMRKGVVQNTLFAKAAFPVVYLPWPSCESAFIRIKKDESPVSNLEVLLHLTS